MALVEIRHGNWEQQQYSGSQNGISGIITTTSWGQLEAQAVEMTVQRAGTLVAEHQMDTTNCLIAFSLICNWPRLWLSSMALPAVLSSAVGSPLGAHPAASVQAPISVTVPEGAVGLLVMPCPNKICLISSVQHPWHHFFPLFFAFLISLLSHIHVSCCDQSQRGILWYWYKIAHICHFMLC